MFNQCACKAHGSELLLVTSGNSQGWCEGPGTQGFRVPVTSPRTEHSAKEFLLFMLTWVCEFALSLGEGKLGEFVY